MKIPKNFLIVFLSLMSSCCFAQSTDTLRVSQSDTTVFRKHIILVRRHYSPIPDFMRPKLDPHYVLINPQAGAYYFIYNDKKQLILEGIYATNANTNQDKAEERGAFYNSKNYVYKKNGKLSSINYWQDGRSHKIAYFDHKKRLKEVRYFDKKTADTQKIEIYKKGELKETIVCMH